MRTKIVDKNLIIHTVPLAEVHVGQTDVRVEFDDIYEKTAYCGFCAASSCANNYDGLF